MQWSSSPIKKKVISFGQSVCNAIKIIKINSWNYSKNFKVQLSSKIPEESHLFHLSWYKNLFDINVFATYECCNLYIFM